MTKLWRDSVDKNFVELKKKQDYVEKRFNEIKQWRGKADKRFDKIEYQLDEVTKIALDNQREIKENMATKQDLSEMNDRIMGALDEVLGVVKKIDQEQVFMGNRISRLEQPVGI